MDLHHCGGCGRDLPSVEFNGNRRRSNGLSYYCRDCSTEQARARYAVKKAAQGKPVVAQRNEPTPPGHRWCPRCKQVLSVTAFGLNRSGRDGLNGYCRDCHNLNSNESRERNGGSRNYHLRRRYGIGVDEFDAMYAAQGGKCGACRERKAEHVDHDHETGKVRGLLCFTCNVALGNTGDDPGRLRALIEYLAAHGVAPVTTLTANTRRLPGVAGGFRDEIGPGVWRLRVAA